MRAAAEKERKDTMSIAQARDILRLHRSRIKKTIKAGIAGYAPLNAGRTYKDFLARLEKEDFKLIRQVPPQVDWPKHFDDLIKDFLVENCYYTLAEKYIQQRIMSKLGILEANDIKVLELVDFVQSRLEKDGLKKLKTFKGNASFKTFLATAVTRLIFDFWRTKRRVGKQVTRYEPEFEAMFDPPAPDPQALLLQSEDEECRQKTLAFLPQLIKQLSVPEKLAIQMRYDHGSNISAIARTLGLNHYKTRTLLKNLERQIKMKLKASLNPGGGRHDTPDR